MATRVRKIAANFHLRKKTRSGLFRLEKRLIQGGMINGYETMGAWKEWTAASGPQAGGIS